MDGLEAVELKLSEVLDDNESKRIDSEYFKKEYLQSIHLLKSKKFKILEEDGTVKGGKRLPLGEDFSNEGIPYIRAEDNKNNFVAYENSPKISEMLHQQLKAYQTKRNDVLITIVGNSIGDVGIVKFDLTKCNLTENCAKIEKLKTISPDYLFIYLNSKFGSFQIKREAVGTAQPKLAIERIRKLCIPVLSDFFQLQIENFVQSSHQKLEESKKLYREAEKLLLEELGLNDFTPSKECVAIKSFSKSFGISGRLDSEYYQPKYEDVKNKIENYPYGYKSLSEICRLHDSNFTPKDNEMYKYIELSNIGGNGEIQDCMNEYGSELPTRARRKVKSGQVIVSSIEGSLPSIAIINSEYDGALCSTGFYVISSEQMNSETLLVLLKNDMMQLLLKKGCSGTILTAIGKDEFQSIPLPLIDTNIQKIIAEKISESFMLRAESKRLLKEAKTAVEKAIEQGENL